MLHEVTADGGVGFCQAALPALLPPCYHGPLVVALDSNVLIDLQQHGAELLSGEDVGVQANYEEELGSIVDIWMLVSAENSDGFSEVVARTVRENSRVLGFDKSDFEDVEW